MTRFGGASTGKSWNTAKQWGRMSTASSRAAPASALALGTHSEVHGHNADPARHMVGLVSDDVTAEWKRLKAAGVEFIEDPKDYGTVWVATLKDPEGNLIQLVQFKT